MIRLPWMKDKEKEALEEEADRVLTKLSKLDPTTEGYRTAVENLSVITDCQTELAKSKQGSKVSKDTVLTVAGSVLSVVIIVAYEHGHVFVSKAANFVMKARA